MGENNNVKDATGAGETGKIFTQEDVNRIVSERLGKERDKAKKEQDAAFAERERAVSAREMHMAALEKLSSRGLPVELAEAINCSDEKTIDKCIEILAKNYTGTPTGGKPPYSPQNGGVDTSGGIRQAMGLR